MKNVLHNLPHPGDKINRLRLLGLRRASQEKRATPSCVMLQIDGLSYRNFRRALQTGKLPFLSRLIREKKTQAGPWHSMLPTSTSAFQTGLFYGNNENVPGFFWYDKARRSKVKMNGAEDTARLEEEVRQRVAPYPGLLAGGSSYSALFTGGAENTFLTFARLFSPRYNMKARRGWIWLFILSQFLLVARIAYYATIEFCLCLYDLARTMLTNRNRAAEFKFVFPRIFSVVVCREIATLATILDISRGVGPIYVNYFAYDEHAHLRGPNSRFAFWTLRGIDASIRRIWKTAEKAKKNGIRHYDVFVWSDHGQTPSVPFQDLFQEDPIRHFDQLFRTLYGPLSPPRNDGGRGTFHTKRGRKRKKELHVSPGYVEMQARRAEQLSEATPGWVRRLLRPLLRPAREIEAYWERLFPPDPQRRISFVSTGPVAHLCVDGNEGQLTFEDWCARYPFYIELIAQHKGIGFSLVRTRAGGCRVGYEGQWLDLMDVEVIRKNVPLGLAQIMISRREDLRRWANMPSAGDLLIFGQREPDRPAIAYSYEHGSHGGPSPHETLPFIVVPAEVAPEWPEVSMEKVSLEKSEPLLTLRDLHERLRWAYNPQIILEESAGSMAVVEEAVEEEKAPTVSEPEA